MTTVYKLDKERHLKLGFGGIARLEILFNKKVNEWPIPGLSFFQVGAVLVEAAKAEDAEITLDKIYDLVDKHSNMSEAFSKCYECIAKAFDKNQMTKRK